MCAGESAARFTNKAREELDADDLDVDDIRESLVNAVAIYKSIRSTNAYSHHREILHIIQAPTLSGVALYTKGKLSQEDGEDVYYLLISSKRAL